MCGLRKRPWTTSSIFLQEMPRVALNNLEIAVDYVMGEGETPKILDLASVELALSRKALAHDKDGEEHYDLISAFHKALRGSDEQASLYWLYRMLMAGEDPLFICRRMIRFCVGGRGARRPLCPPVTLCAFKAWEKVGPPEAELALAEAVVTWHPLPRAMPSMWRRKP